MRFFKGDKMYWKKTGLPAYEKLNDDEWGTWVSLDSYYLVRTEEMVRRYNPTTGVETNTLEVVYKRHPESELLVERRFGFKWTDFQVYGIMNFETLGTKGAWSMKDF